MKELKEHLVEEYGPFIDMVCDEVRTYSNAFMGEMVGTVIEMGDKGGYEKYVFTESLYDRIVTLEDTIDAKNIQAVIDGLQDELNKVMNMLGLFLNRIHPLCYTAKEDEVAFNINSYRLIMCGLSRAVYGLRFMRLFGYCVLSSPFFETEEEWRTKRIMMVDENNEVLRLMRKYINGYEKITMDGGIRAMLERFNDVLVSMQEFSEYAMKSHHKSNYLIGFSSDLYHYPWDPRSYVLFDWDVTDEQKEMINANVLEYEKYLNKCICKPLSSDKKK